MTLDYRCHHLRLLDITLPRSIVQVDTHKRLYTDIVAHLETRNPSFLNASSSCLWKLV